jgi:tripartite-type tricarboxylate transporter receptor subunit TctC
MGLWCTPDVPAAAQANVRDAMLKALADPAVRARILDTGFEAGSPRTSDEKQKELRADSERVGKVLNTIGFKPE